MVKFPLDVTDVMDVGKVLVDELTDPENWNPPEQPLMTSPQVKVIAITGLIGIPVAVYQAFRYAQLASVYGWADDVIRESWIDDFIRQFGHSEASLDYKHPGYTKGISHSAKKKLLAKILLRLIPVFGWAMAVIDLYLIYNWIDEQLNSPSTSASGQRGNVKKQMRSTSRKKYSRRKYYARKRY